MESLYRQCIKRRADSTCDGQRRRGKQELVNAVPGAVMADRFEIPDLAERDAHMHQRNDVQRLEQVDLVRPDLAAPGVGGDGGDVMFVQPRHSV